MALSIVYAPKDAVTPPSIDIVAVHGLGGDLIETWTHPKSKAFWLKDFLPEQIPDARIMTFGYNANAAFGQSTAEVVDHAKSLLVSLVDKREDSEEMKRPLIFIAHSLGGIVVKQALFQARLESRYQSLQKATLGLIFLGTPHRGSDKATYGKVLANVAQFVTHRPPSRLLSALQTNSHVLFGLTTNFRSQLPDYQVYSFYEQRPMKGLSTLIVEKHSALLEVNHEEQIPVDSDHSAICKFEKADDDTFEKIYKRVRRMTKNLQRPTDDQSVSYNKHFEVSHLLSPVFTGHDKIQKSLESSLEPARRLSRSVQGRFALYGLGGSGKTQICLQYAQKHRERYWGIFWIHASTHHSVQQSFTKIAHLLQVDPNVDSVKRELAHMSHAWLLIFDNVVDPELSLTLYLPAGGRGDIIITSRNPACQRYSTVGFHEVAQLSIDDSVSLLTKMISGAKSPLQEAVKDYQKVVAALGHLALAVVQAGAYIRESSCTLPEYLEMYERRRNVLLQELPKHLGTDYQDSVYATWQISVKMIESRHDTVSRQTLRLLELLGFYNYEQIPLQMFYNACERSHEGEDASNYLPWHESGADCSNYRQSVQNSVSLLASFSLIGRNSDASLSLHPLVHKWCRDRLSNVQKGLAYHQALLLLAGSVHRTGVETEDFDFRRSLVPHVHELLRVRTHQSEVGEKNIMQAWPVLALILRQNGWAQDAVQLSEEVLRLQRSKLDENHADTLQTMHDLSIAYIGAGRQTEAFELSEKVVKLRNSKLGEDHIDTLNSMQNLAADLSNAGRVTEGLELSEKVLALYKRKLGEDNAYTIRSMQRLAKTLGKIGRKTEAITLLEQAVQLGRSKLGEAHPYTLTSIHDLAIEYDTAGRLTEASQLLDKVLQMRKSKLGEDHPSTLGTLNSLAYQHSRAGRHKEALLLLEQILQLRKRKLGEDHPDTLPSMHDIAYEHYDAGKRTEALQLSEEVLQLCMSKLGEDHPSTLNSMHNLAFFSHGVERETEAIQLLEQVVPLRNSKLGAGHPDTVDSMHKLAIFYYKVGRETEAIQLLEQIVLLRKSNLGVDHPTTLLSMYNQAIGYRKTGRQREALELNEEVLQLRKGRLGKDHPDTLKSIRTLAIDYKNAGRWKEALQLAEELLQLRKTKLGEDHPDTIESLQLYLELTSVRHELAKSWRKFRSRGSSD